MWQGVRRCDRSRKTYIDIYRPFVASEYNRHIGGIDLINSITRRQTILLRSKRWPIRMFHYYLDLLISNACLLYKHVLEEKQKNKTMLHYADFRFEIAEILCDIITKSKAMKRKKNQFCSKKSQNENWVYSPKTSATRWNRAEKIILCKY